MNLLNNIFWFVFAGNVTLRCGIGLGPSEQKIQTNIEVILFGIASAFSCMIFYLIKFYLVDPLRLSLLVPLLFLFFNGILFSIIGIFCDFLLCKLKKLDYTSNNISNLLIRFLTNGSVFSIAILVSDVSPTMLQSILSGFFAAMGLWIVNVLHDSIIKKLDTEDVPKSLRKTPVYFISAGLIALAFSGFDRLIQQTSGG